MSGKHAEIATVGGYGEHFGRHRAENVAEPTNTAQIPRVGDKHGRLRRVVVTTSALALIPASASGAQFIAGAFTGSEPVDSVEARVDAPVARIDVPPAKIEYPSVEVSSKPSELPPTHEPVTKDAQELTKKTKLSTETAKKPAVPAPVKVPPKAIVIVPPKPPAPPVVVPPVSQYANGAIIAAAALAQLGRRQDCTKLVTNSLAAVGISHHGWPLSYTTLGDRVAPKDALPGDLIYYVNGGLGLAHVAVYIGNGMAVHGGWNGNQTVTFKANVGSGPVYIRARVK